MGQILGPEVLESIKANWISGKSGSDCSMMAMRDHGVSISREAIIGRANRAKPKWRQSGVETLPSETNQGYHEKLDQARGGRPKRSHRKLEVKKPKVIAPPSWAMRKDDSAIAPRVEVASRSLTLLELEPRDCRYPTSPDSAPSILFCGAESVADGLPYCALHHVRCNRPTARQSSSRYR